MAKWLAVLLALIVVAAGVFYVWRHQPLQEALEAAGVLAPINPAALGVEERYKADVLVPGNAREP